MRDPIRAIQIDVAIYGWAIIPADLLAPYLAREPHANVRRLTRAYVRVSVS